MSFPVDPLPTHRARPRRVDNEQTFCSCLFSAGGSETGEKSRFMPVSFDRVRLVQISNIKQSIKHRRAVVPEVCNVGFN